MKQASFYCFTNKYIQVKSNYLIFFLCKYFLSFHYLPKYNERKAINIIYVVVLIKEWEGLRMGWERTVLSTQMNKKIS